MNRAKVCFPAIRGGRAFSPLRSHISSSTSAFSLLFHYERKRCSCFACLSAWGKNAYATTRFPIPTSNRSRARTSTRILSSLCSVGNVEPDAPLSRQDWNHAIPVGKSLRLATRNDISFSVIPQRHRRPVSGSEIFFWFFLRCPNCDLVGIRSPGTAAWLAV